METTGTPTLAPAERPKKPSRRIAAALHMSRAVYRRMKQRAAGEGLSFGTWLKRAALKELRRKSEI
jgi:hypothetical protein